MCLPIEPVMAKLTTEALFMRDLHDGLTIMDALPGLFLLVSPDRAYTNFSVESGDSLVFLRSITW
jgi:hypothetical protein